MKEQRGYVRLNVDAQALFRLKNTDDPKSQVDLEDIGCNGIRIICNRRLTEKDILELVLQIPGIDGDILVEGKSVWQREIAANTFDTGIQFTCLEEPSKHKLYKFIEDSTGRTVERREYVRCDCKSLIIYSILDNPEVKKDCTSVDVCGVGLKVMAKEQLEKGTQLRVEFKLPGQDDAIEAKCTVVAWVKKGQEDLFETGIEFLEISDEDKQKISSFVEKKCKSKQ
jgi:hypothetical protein